MNWKKVETGPNRTEKTEPDRLQFGLKKTDEKPLRTGPIKTGCNRFKMATNTPRKYASFAPIFKRNGAELNFLQPKQYVTSKYDFLQYLILVFFELYKIIITINYL